MSRRLLAFAMPIAFACTSAEPEPEPAPAPSPAVEPLAEPSVEPTLAAPARALPSSTDPWQWYHQYPAKLADSFSELGVGPVAHSHQVGDPRRYTARRDAQGVELECERVTEHDTEGEPTIAWRQRVPTTASLVGEPVVQSTTSRDAPIVVGLRNPGGYELHAFTGDGSPVRSTRVLDPTGFDEPGAKLQLDGAAEHARVYVRGEGGAYLDVLHPETAEPVARATFGASVLHDRFEWPPQGPHGQGLDHRWPSERGTYQVRRRGDAIELRAFDRAAKARFTTTLEPDGGPWFHAAAVVEHGDTVVVVTYSGASSGATVHGIDRERGTLRFTTSPGNIGPIGHSMYHNEVALGLDAHGHVLIHGHESGGDYLGVLDVEAGRLLGHEAWRR